MRAVSCAQHEVATKRSTIARRMVVMRKSLPQNGGLTEFGSLEEIVTDPVVSEGWPNKSNLRGSGTVILDGP